MARKPKATGFTRFLIAMVIVIPIAYLIASYANGEDGLQNVKEVVGIGTAPVSVEAIDIEDNETYRDLQRQLELKNQKIETLEAENARLREQLSSHLEQH